MPASDKRARFFTLVEIMVAVGIFSILALALFLILNGILRSWSITTQSTQVLANARIALSFIATDLKGVTASSLEGERVYVDGAGVGARDVAFVCNSLYSSSSSSTLCEVGYGLEDDKLLRWETGDVDGSKWNFLNATPDVWAADSSWGTVNTVIDGVETFTVQFYRSAGSSPYYTAYNVATESHVTPDLAVVTLTLVAPSTVGLPANLRDKTRQTFTEQLDLTRD